MEIKFFLSMKIFQFPKFHENGTKYDKCNFNRGLIVTFKFMNL